MPLLLEDLTHLPRLIDEVFLKLDDAPLEENRYQLALSVVEIYSCLHAFGLDYSDVIKLGCLLWVLECAEIYFF